MPTATYRFEFRTEDRTDSLWIIDQARPERTVHVEWKSEVELSETAVLSVLRGLTMEFVKLHQQPAGDRR